MYYGAEMREFVLRWMDDWKMDLESAKKIWKRKVFMSVLFYHNKRLKKL